MADFLQWLGPGALVALVIAVFKFNGDYTRLKAIVDGVIQENKRIEAQNKEQHLAYDKNEKDIIEMKVYLKNLITSVDNITKMLERRGERRE
jgi:hypothetical protein